MMNFFCHYSEHSVDTFILIKLNDIYKYQEAREEYLCFLSTIVSGVFLCKYPIPKKQIHLL